MQLRPTLRGDADLPRIRTLYESAFPANERRDFETMVNDGKSSLELYSCRENGEFCGFVCILNSIGIAHIIYFAVEPDKRDRGLGSEILQAVHRMKEGHRVIVDIELESPDGDFSRHRRKQFYLRNGYAETEVKYRWEHEDYEILSYGGAITDEEFGRFWQSLDRKDAAAGV